MCKIFSNTTKQAHQNADRVSGCCSGEEMVFLGESDRQIDSIDYVPACELGFMKKSYIPVRNFLRMCKIFLAGVRFFVNTTKQTDQKAGHVSGCRSVEERMFLANPNHQMGSTGGVLACQLDFA